jgi:transposase
MKPKQSIIKRSRISEQKLREIIRYFVYDLEATKVAEMTGLTRKTIDRYYRKIRTAITLHQHKTTPFSEEVELDESYFGGKRKGKDKRGRCVIDKVPVFGIKKRDGRVYTQIIKNASRAELKPIIKQLIEKDSTIYTDGWKAYDGLVLDGYKHYRINHSKEFAQGKTNHINGIENFWGWCKMRLAKFRGLHRHTFLLHLKESEWRFNHRYLNAQERYRELLKIVRKEL